MMSDNVVMMS